ncbi:beta-ketoacyl synthase N-terminal-like domain-containing protein, partial [Luteibacter sp. CQ10]|uniref:beta-ketoacyl synthase N-terminal-like domain-containing protein n=1 Tax=Luteibacter sp. CQ10 TaxID=2805821 RepID=UPI0034A350B7
HAPAFICYFSSTSAVLGDFGGGDYAIGNRFQSAWARHVAATDGIRRIAIEWPLWTGGGMRDDDDEATRMYLRSSGQRALSDEAGMAILERALAMPSGAIMPLVGDRERIARHLGWALAATPTSREDAVVPEPVPAPAPTVAPSGMSLERRVERELVRQASELLKLASDRIDTRANLADYGFDSLSMGEWARRIARDYGIAFTPALFFSHPTLERVRDYLLDRHAEAVGRFHATTASERADEPAPAVTATTATSMDATSVAAVADADEPIAIIGMSGRFPQARSVAELWRILRDGTHAVGEIPDERFAWRDAYERGEIAGKWLGAMPGIGEFDASFFDISPREARSMDPRQRLLIQEGWRALEDAGYGEEHLRQAIGMFVGVEQGEYQTLPGVEGTLTANHDGILASRLSFFLNLRGTAMAINTTCSSGLVAAHTACLSLRAGECDAAVVAAVNLSLSAAVYAGMSHAGMLSRSGRCHAFDRRADGLVPADAVVAIVLKRLSRAQAEGDPIHAVIRASGTNYDGRTNGITAPNGTAQAELIRAVHRRARVTPRDVDYIVTHGTATPLGDPVEVIALQEVFGGVAAGDAPHCALTSTKSNVGHSFAASGLVSLVGAVEALRHECIPASLNCEEPSDHVRWDESALFVNRQSRPWPADASRRRRVGVSAFGMSGTNAHVLLEDYPPYPAPSADVPPAPWLLAVSAKSPAALARRLADLARFVRSREWNASAARSLAYTLLCGRLHFSHRCVVVGRDADDAVRLLERAAAGERPDGVFDGSVARGFRETEAVAAEGRERLGRGGPDALRALAKLYCQGYALPWSTLFGGTPPRRLALPTYPFARDIHWVDPSSPQDTSKVQRMDLSAPGDSMPTDASRAREKPVGIALKRLASSAPAAKSAPARATEARVVRSEPVAAEPPGATDAAPEVDPDKLRDDLAHSLADALYMDVGEVEPHRPFAEMGLDSIIGVEWVRAINLRHGLQMPTAKIYDHPDLDQLARYVATLVVRRPPEPPRAFVAAPAPVVPSERVDVASPAPAPAPAPAPRFAPPRAGGEPIAIVGMAGRYPGASDLEAFWQRLAEGHDAVTEVPTWRWDVNRYYEAGQPRAGRINCKWLGALDEVDCFDPLFFSISPAEAELMDPQQRLFVQEAYRAFEDAGCNPRALGDSRCGVYLGIMSNDYATLLHDSGQASDSTGNSAAIAASRISYLLDLKGPAISIDTACSSSLVATHLACQALRNEEIELALVGGVTLYLTPGPYLGMCAAGMLSSDGRCKTMDDGANGFVPGE